MGVHDGHREKKKAQFLAHGLDAFADHEALELLLFYAIPRRDTNETAHLLMERFGTLDAVFSAPIEELRQVEGLGDHAATLLKLVPQIDRRARLAAAEREDILNSTQRAGAYLLERFAGEKNEILYELCLDRKGKLIACRRLAEGSVSAVAINIRRLVENALLSGASGIILAHNHPSGVALPSQDDYSATKLAEDALRTVNIPLLDHIIVADNDFVSLADSGFLRG
ncbi:MAG: DNA repair protein RadC [Oscillospiraceae bacterium]